MKTTSHTHLFRGALVGLALFAATATYAQESYLVNSFDTYAETNQWQHWWGAPETTISWDDTVDAGGSTNATSGALKLTVAFEASLPDNQYCFLRDLPSNLSSASYTNLVMDIRIDPSSPKRPVSQDYGYLEFGYRYPNWDHNFFGRVALPATNDWIHLEAAIPTTSQGSNDIAGITFKMWAGGPPDGISGNYIFWVDNIQLMGNTNTAPPPPPTLGIQRAMPGLQLFASVPGSQWQRQNIRTAAGTYNWTGLPFDPVTYSLTITNFPGRGYGGFQAHMFLVPSVSGSLGASPDWDQPNVVFLQISQNNDGSAGGRFMYKTNQPGGNSMLWNTEPANGPVGTLATIGNSTAVGTWSLSFVYDQITLTTPSGATTNFAMPLEALGLFHGPDADPMPLYAFFGVQPNELANIGQSAVFSRVQIEGLGPIDDTFSAVALDTTIWQVVADQAAGVLLVPADSAYWLKWTLPDTAFGLITSPNLELGSWIDPALANILRIGDGKMVLVPATALPGTDSGYFQLMKP